MMALPHTQYVIAETSTPVSGVNSNQVKTVSKHCLIPVFQDDAHTAAAHQKLKKKK